MSISSDGILAFGWNLGDYLELDWLDDEDNDIVYQIDKRLLEKLAGFTEVWAKDNTGYYERENIARNSTGAELIIHCSYEYPMYFLAAKGSESRAWRGSTESITSLEEQPEWRDNLNKARGALELKDLGEPSWQLFSVMG